MTTAIFRYGLTSYQLAVYRYLAFCVGSRNIRGDDQGQRARIEEWRSPADLQLLLSAGAQ